VSFVVPHAAQSDLEIDKKATANQSERRVDTTPPLGRLVLRAADMRTQVPPKPLITRPLTVEASDPPVTMEVTL
jgi:hypothetical protein